MADWRVGDLSPSTVLMAASILIASACQHPAVRNDLEPEPRSVAPDPAPAVAERSPNSTLAFEEAAAESSPAPNKPGLPVGELAPGFTLQDQEGRSVSLVSLLEQGPVALVFFRSADWCLYCKMQSMQLQQHLAEIEATGGRIVGISFDSVEILKRFADRGRITFPLLSDVGSHTIDAYRIRNASEGAPDGVAYHGTFVVDRDGIIRSKFYQVSYAERPAVDNLVRALNEARVKASDTNQ